MALRAGKAELVGALLRAGAKTGVKNKGKWLSEPPARQSYLTSCFTGRSQFVHAT